MVEQLQAGFLQVTIVLQPNGVVLIKQIQANQLLQ